VAVGYFDPVYKCAMNPRSFLSLLALAVAAWAIWWTSRPATVAPQRRETDAVVPSAPPATQQGSNAEPLKKPEPEAQSAVPPVSEPAGAVPAPSTAALSPAVADADLEKVQMTFRDYQNALGENPVGTNAEITKALLGDNLKQLQLSVPAGSRLNEKGEMIDRWGTPYFFHQLSAKQMEIRSAGPDRQLWTADDRLQH
jgi:hypothetical protein